MIDKSNEIFERIQNAIQALCDSVSQTRKDSPAQFPHVLVETRDNLVTVTDLENNECAVTSTIEITAYTEDGLSSAEKIIHLADQEMQRMGFQRVLGPQQATNLSDTRITEVMVRYQRLIADGDEL